MTARRIAFFSTMEGYAWGGSEELWSRAAMHLRARGVEVAANVLRWPEVPAAVTRLEQSGVRVYRRPPRVDKFLRRQLRRVGALPKDPDVDWLKAERADLAVLSLGSNFEGRQLMLGCRAAGIRYAIVNQAVQDVWFPADAGKAQMRELYESAAACFCLAASNLRSLQRQLASPLANARLARNPFSVDYNVRLPWPAEDGGTRLALVARLEPYAKGQDVLLEALAAKKWRQRPLSVSLYGDGPLKTFLGDLARYYGVEGQVVFAGVTRDVAAIWAAHHALVLPSRIEGMPLSAIEAMLCGRPCIVSPAAGCEGELVQDGETGFVSAAATAAALDETLERAWQRRTSWPELGRRAADHVRTLVPADPGAAFADQLMALAAS